MLNRCVGRRPAPVETAACISALIGIVTFAGLIGCSSTPPAKMVAEPDPTLVSLTQWLELDSAQQEKTHQLLEELRLRHTEILEKWSKTKVRPEDLIQSRAIFERGFMAILTPEQRRLFASMKVKLQMKGRNVKPAS